MARAVVRERAGAQRWQAGCDEHYHDLACGLAAANRRGGAGAGPGVGNLVIADSLNERIGLLSGSQHTVRTGVTRWRR